MNTCVRGEVCVGSGVLSRWWTVGKYEHLCGGVMYLWGVRCCPAGGQSASMNTCVGGEVCVGSEVLSRWWTVGKYEHLCGGVTYCPDGGQRVSMNTCVCVWGGGGEVCVGKVGIIQLVDRGQV